MKYRLEVYERRQKSNGFEFEYYPISIPTSAPTGFFYVDDVPSIGDRVSFYGAEPSCSQHRVVDRCFEYPAYGSKIWQGQEQMPPVTSVRLFVEATPGMFVMDVTPRPDD